MDAFSTNIVGLAKPKKLNSKGAIMALNDNKTKIDVNANVRVKTQQEQPARQASRQAQPEQPAQPAQQVRRVTLGTIGTGIMRSTMGSKYTIEITTAIKEVYATMDARLRPKLFVFDKEVQEDMEYSAIVVSYGVRETINYFIILLEGTGDKPMLAKDIGQELNYTMQTNKYPDIWTPDGAIDKELHADIQEVLFDNYGDKIFMSVDGMIVPTQHAETEVIAHPLARIAYNACYVDSALEAGVIAELNLRESATQNPNKEIRIEPTMVKQTIVNELGRPMRSDFVVATTIKDRKTQGMEVQGRRKRGLKTTACKVSGFIDTIHDNVITPTMTGMPIKQLRLAAQVIITSVDTQYEPTPGYVMLGIITALKMTERNNYINSLLPVDKLDKHHVGVLNMLTNLENNANGIGGMIDITSAKVTPEKAYGYLNEMFALKPLLCMDVDTFGPQTFFQSLLVVGARPTASVDQQGARVKIIETLVALTAGAFPANYPTDKIFAHAGVLLPAGTWLDKSGERDIRDVDSSFIMKELGDPNLVTKWVVSGLPMANGDNFNTRVELLSLVLPEAEIHGKVIRVTFHDEFVQILSQAALASGANLLYDPENRGSQDINLDAIGGYMKNAGISNMTQFTTPSMSMGNGFQTQYGNTGYHRYR